MKDQKNQELSKTSNHGRLEVRRWFSHTRSGCAIVAIASQDPRFECTPSATSNPSGGARLGEFSSERRLGGLPLPTLFFNLEP